VSHPYCYSGSKCQLEPFFTMKCRNQRALACNIDAIGASARPMTAFSGFYENHGPPPSGDARGIVPAHCDGHWNSQQSGFILRRRTVCCRPGGRQGNMEQVVARWRRLVASIKALDLLHRSMRAILHHCTTMAIKIASDGGAFVRRRQLFRLL